MKQAGMICLWISLSASVAFAQLQPIPPVKPITPVYPIKPMWKIRPVYGPGATPTPDACRDDAQSIRDEYIDLDNYQNAVTAWDKETATSTDPNFEDAEKNKADLRQELSRLAQLCGGWGALGGGPLPGGSSGGNANSGGGSSGGGGGSGSGSGGGKTATPLIPRPIGGPNAVAIVLGGTSGAPGASGRTVPKGFPTMLVRDQIARTQLGDTWRQLPAQPTVQPRQDTNVEASAATPPAPRIIDASEMARTGLAAVDQIEQETAALNAYSLSLARFLGAQQNHDRAGMSRQAQLMIEFIKMALQAAKSAARSRLLADKLILSELERRQASAKRKPGGWSVELPNLGRTSTSALPPEVVDELRRSGLETPGMAQLRHDLDALTPAEIDAEIAVLRAQVKAESAIANGPQPPDLANLERERLRAHELASSAGVSPKSE
jgi:hypothetical protein